MHFLLFSSSMVSKRCIQKVNKKPLFWGHENIAVCRCTSYIQLMAFITPCIFDGWYGMLVSIASMAIYYFAGMFYCEVPRAFCIWIRTSRVSIFNFEIKRMLLADVYLTRMHPHPKNCPELQKPYICILTTVCFCLCRIVWRNYQTTWFHQNNGQPPTHHNHHLLLDTACFFTCLFTGSCD